MTDDTATESAFEAQHLDARMTWKTAPWFAWDLETTARVQFRNAMEAT